MKSSSPASSSSSESSSMSDERRDKKKKKKSKKKSKSKKDSARLYNKEDLDLSKEMFPICHYIEDRQEMTRQVFNVVKGARLQAMLPPLLKELPVKELMSRCLEQLETMSRETILRILTGKESSPLRPAQIPDSQLATRLENQGTVARCVEGACTEAVKRKSVEKEKPLEPKKKKTTGEVAENEEGKTLMEILEMEMRARAIKAMLRRDKEVEAETEKEQSPKTGQDPEHLALGPRQVLPAEPDEQPDQQVNHLKQGVNDVMGDWPPAMIPAITKSPRQEPSMQKKDATTREEKRAPISTLKSTIAIKKSPVLEAGAGKVNEQDSSFIKEKSLPKEDAPGEKKGSTKSDKKRKADKEKAHKEENCDRMERKELKKTKAYDRASPEKILPQVQLRQYRKAERSSSDTRQRNSRSRSPRLTTKKNPNQGSSTTRKSRRRSSSISLSASPPPVKPLENRHRDSPVRKRSRLVPSSAHRKPESRSRAARSVDKGASRSRRYSHSPGQCKTKSASREKIAETTENNGKQSNGESDSRHPSCLEAGTGLPKRHVEDSEEDRARIVDDERAVLMIPNLEEGELQSSEESEVNSFCEDIDSPDELDDTKPNAVRIFSCGNLQEKIYSNDQAVAVDGRRISSRTSTRDAASLSNQEISLQRQVAAPARETADLEKVSDSEEDFTTDMNFNDGSNDHELPILNPEYDVCFGDVEDEHSHDKTICLTPAPANDGSIISSPPSLTEQEIQRGHHISEGKAKLYEDSNVRAHDEVVVLDRQPVADNSGYDSEAFEKKADTAVHPSFIGKPVLDRDKKAECEAVGLESECDDAERHLLQSDKNEIVSELRDDHNNEVEVLQKIQSRGLEAQPAHPTELSEIGRDEEQQLDVYTSDINNGIQVVDRSSSETKQVLIEMEDTKKDEESASLLTTSMSNQKTREERSIWETNSDPTAVTEEKSSSTERQQDSIGNSSMALGENNCSLVADGKLVAPESEPAEESARTEVGSQGGLAISETPEVREVLSMSEFKKQQGLEKSSQDGDEDEEDLSWSERWYRNHDVKKVIETSRMFGKVRSQLRSKLLHKKYESPSDDLSLTTDCANTVPVETRESLSSDPCTEETVHVNSQEKEDSPAVIEFSLTPPPPPPPDESESVEEELWEQILG